MLITTNKNYSKTFWFFKDPRHYRGERGGQKVVKMVRIYSI